MAITFQGKSSGSAINGGNVTLTISSSAVVKGNDVIVTYATPISPAGGHSVRSSIGAGDPYTLIKSTFSSSNVVMSIWRRTLTSTGIVQAVCIGTGGSTDATAAVLMVFDDDGGNLSIESTLPSTSGSGTTPDSPQITVSTSYDVVLSCVAASIADATVTAPTSFVNQADANGSDTRPVTVGMAMITLASTAAFDPGTWTNFTSATWISATVGLVPGSTIWQSHTMFQYELPSGRIKETMVGY